MTTLNNWALVAVDFSPYQAPEQHDKRLHGTVTGHPGFPDGAEVTTSRIIGVNPDGTVQTKSRAYTLGMVDPGYEAVYPDAHAKLLAAWKAAS